MKKAIIEFCIECNNYEPQSNNEGAEIGLCSEINEKVSGENPIFPDNCPFEDAD